MPVTIHVTGQPLEDFPLAPEQLMKEIGLLALRLIRTRTEKQTDVHGRPFRPLSAGYAAQKAAAGLPGEPDLTVSGRMLNDMAITEITDGKVSLGFLSAGGTAPRTGRRKR